MTELELAACTPRPLKSGGFNARAVIPLGCTADHLRSAMDGFLDFLGFVNAQLHSRGMVRLETMLMPANFSSMVGEFAAANLPRYCTTLVKNRYHNGHPDLVRAGTHTRDAVQHHHEGIEIKASRYASGWQGHNAEDTWLMVFVFDSSRPQDVSTGAAPRPFRFVSVVGAQLAKADWQFSGRSAESRRTITASVSSAAVQRMKANWIYDDQ